MQYLSSSNSHHPLTDRLYRSSSECLYYSRRLTLLSTAIVIVAATTTITTTTHAFSPNVISVVPTRRTITQRQKQQQQQQSSGWTISSSFLSVLANPQVNDESISLDGNNGANYNTNDGSITLPSSIAQDDSATTTPSSSIDNDNDNDTTDPKEFNWSFLEKAYIITCPNADPNGERLTNAKSILAGVGLDDGVVDVKEFDTDDEDRIRGCYTSHISVIEDAIVDLNIGLANGGDRKKNGTPDVADRKSVV